MVQDQETAVAVAIPWLVSLTIPAVRGRRKLTELKLFIAQASDPDGAAKRALDWLPGATVIHVTRLWVSAGP